MVFLTSRAIILRGGSILYTAGNVGSVINSIAENLYPNNIHTIHIVAESQTGVLGTTKVLSLTTPACPPVYLLTGFPVPTVCVNKGQLAIFTIELPDTDPLIPGKQTDVNVTGVLVEQHGALTGETGPQIHILPTQTMIFPLISTFLPISTTLHLIVYTRLH